MTKTIVGSNHVKFLNDSEEEVVKIEVDHSNNSSSITILDEIITIDHSLKTIDLGNFSILSSISEEVIIEEDHTTYHSDLITELDGLTSSISYVGSAYTINDDLYFHVNSGVVDNEVTLMTGTLAQWESFQSGWSTGDLGIMIRFVDSPPFLNPNNQVFWFSDRSLLSNLDNVASNVFFIDWAWDTSEVWDPRDSSLALI